MREFALTAGVAALIAGCGEQQPRVENDPMVAATGTGGPPAPSDTSTGSESDDDSALVLDVPADGTSIGGNDSECASFSAMADVRKQPADILWVVDNSPSMVDEAAAVRERLNAFSDQIVEAGIDARVFLLTSFPNLALPPELDTGICIEPPLGGGGCPTGDNNPPHFGHAQALIGSNAALTELIDSYPLWEPMLRTDSAVHVIVVSDDDSGIDAATFDDTFVGLDSRLDDYQLHGIVSLQTCAASDTVGATYIELAEQTGGLVGDLCEQQFQPLFDLLTTAVTEGTGLECAWALPEPPPGRTIDPDSVEVLYEDDAGTESPLMGVDDLAACDTADGGWYYDDADEPTQVLACPSTCALMQDAQTASIQIDVGCAHKPVG